MAIPEQVQGFLTKPISPDELFGALERAGYRPEQPRCKMNESILIVDDSGNNPDLIQILLEGERFEVRLVGDAETALTALQTYGPHLVLMDIQLPVMDGLELTHSLRQGPTFQDAIIVAPSAYAMQGDEDNALAAGCDGYIKPINPRTFAGAVRGHLQALRPTPSDCELREARATYQEPLPIRGRASDHEPYATNPCSGRRGALPRASKLHIPHSSGQPMRSLPLKDARNNGITA